MRIHSPFFFGAVFFAATLALAAPLAAQDVFWPDDALSVGPAEAPAAPAWREAPFEWTSAQRHPYAMDVANGLHSTLVELPWGYFVVNHDDRAIYRIDYPEWGWIGFAGVDDDLFRLGEHAALYRSQSPYTDWTEVERFDVADTTQTWDSAGNCMAGVSGNEVILSNDGGTTFALTKPDDAVWIDELACRFDGVVAARSVSASQTYLWHPDDGEWTVSPFQPTGLTRYGGVVYSTEGTPRPILSVDGRTWTDEEEIHSLLGGHPSGAALMALTSETEGYPAGTSWYSADTPPPPAVDPTPPTSAQSPTEPGSLSGFGAGGMGMLASRSGVCQGVVCAHGAWGQPARFTRTHAQLFSNATCAEASAEYPESCAADPTWTTAPTVALIDGAEGEMTMVALPADCEDVRVETVEGLVLALCAREGGTAVFARTGPQDGVGDWVAEGILDVPLESIEAPSVGDDATIVLHLACGCDEDCAVFLRPPAALGATWSRLEHPGADLWVALGGGRAAVAYTPDRERPTEAGFAVVTPGAPPAVIANVVLDFEVVGLRADDGRLAIARDSTLTWDVLGADGTLTEVELPRRSNMVEGIPTYRAEPWRGCGRGDEESPFDDVTGSEGG